MLIIFLFLLLLGLSVGVVVAMDLLVGIPLQVSFNNIWLPFESLMAEELLMLLLLFFYSAAHASYRKRKNRAR